MTVGPANAEAVPRNQPVQLPLGLQLPAVASFHAFQTGPNAEARDAALAVVSGGQTQAFLHGDPGTGKSHLLQAACRAAVEAGDRAAYLPLAELGREHPAVLEGLAGVDLVCLDNIAAIAGIPGWEQGLVGLIDRRRQAGRGVLAADRCPPAALTQVLPDLRSRLGWGPVYALRELDDGAKRELLVQRAGQRGLTLTHEVAAYLMRRQSRDVPGLLATVDELDRASLAAKRRLTIPFVKQVLGTC